MKKQLRSRGNTEIDLFNSGNYNMLRFRWVKGLFSGEFSYQEFMKVSKELVELSRQYQNPNVETEILGFNNAEVYSTALSLSGGQDESALHRALGSRNSFSLENFSENNYRESTAPELFIKTPSEKDHFMVCLQASQKYSKGFANIGKPYAVRIESSAKRELQFYGQALKREMFSEMVKRYHYPCFSHSLEFN